MNTPFRSSSYFLLLLFTISRIFGSLIDIGSLNRNRTEAGHDLRRHRRDLRLHFSVTAVRHRRLTGISARHLCADLVRVGRCYCPSDDPLGCQALGTVLPLERLRNRSVSASPCSIIAHWHFFSLVPFSREKTTTLQLWIVSPSALILQQLILLSFICWSYTFK